MKTVTFFSYKGGAGRSLLLANFAKYLHGCGKRVFLLDFDLEAPGLHHKLSQYGLYEDFREWVITGSPKYGLVDYIETYLTSNLTAIPADLSEFVCDLKISPEDDGNHGRCFLMPAGKAPSVNYAESLLGINWKRLFPAESAVENAGTGVPFFKHLKHRILSEYNPDFLLIDSRTGISDIGSIAIRYLADSLVCVFTGSQESLEGTRAILDGVRDYPQQDRIMTIPVLSRVPESGHDAVLEGVQAQLGGTLDGLSIRIIHDEPAAYDARDLRFEGDAALYESVMQRDYLNIFDAIDAETAKISPYYELSQYLLADRSREISGANSSSKAGVNVVDNILGRSSAAIKCAGHYDYVKGEAYAKVTEKIIQKLRSTVHPNGGKLPTVERVSEDNLNWDLLTIQMISQIFDFCSTPYYLTPERGLASSIVQFGRVETFTGVLDFRSPLLAEIDSIVSRDAVGFEVIMRHLSKKHPKLIVGMIGESAATAYAARIISPFINGTRLHFERDATGLANWLQGQTRNSAIALCDHTIALKMTSSEIGATEVGQFVFAENASTINKNLLFKLDDPIPVGFLYSAGDKRWRYQINAAFASSIDESAWRMVSTELREAGIVPSSWKDLCCELVLGMKLIEAKSWLREQKCKTTN